jgi:hypothetical protein
VPVAIGIVRWVVGIGAIYIGLIYLNSFAANIWAAGGPPTDIPQYFLWRAWVALGASVAAFSVSAASFMAIRSAPTRRQLRNATILGLVALVAFGTPYIVRLIMQDDCLDEGGRWSVESQACET